MENVQILESTGLDGIHDIREFFQRPESKFKVTFTLQKIPYVAFLEPVKHFTDKSGSKSRKHTIRSYHLTVQPPDAGYPRFSILHLSGEGNYITIVQNDGTEHPDSTRTYWYTFQTALLEAVLKAHKASHTKSFWKRFCSALQGIFTLRAPRGTGTPSS